MVRERIAAVLVVVVGGLSASSRADAQSRPPDLSTLMRSQILDVWRATTPDGSRILIDPPAEPTLRTLGPFTLVTQIEQQIGTQLTSLPIGSSAGGFTYRYDSHLGTFTRTTDTFGPAFAERAQVLGRSRVNFGMSYQHGRYDDLDGRSLEHGGIRFILPPGTITDPSFGNVIDSELHLRLVSDTTVYFMSAGVTDRFDIGVAVPYQHVAMELTNRATIRDFSTQTVSPPSRVFANGGRTQDFATSGSARGIGDLVVRGKYKLTRPGLREFALCVDLRLPTGDAANFLGAGSAQTQVLLVSSYSSSRIDPHFNVGYTFTDKHAADQINYVSGIEVAVTRRVTIVGDLVGRMFLDTLQLQDGLVQILQPGDAARGIPAAVSTAFGTVDTHSALLATTMGTVGVKFNPARNVLISAHVIATLTDRGLRRRPAPVFGLDYSF